MVVFAQYGPNLQSVFHCPWFLGQVVHHKATRLKQSLTPVSDISLAQPTKGPKSRCALRVALTYESAVKHEFDTTEQFNGSPAMETVTEIELPQSLTLDFQSGIAADTLLFGSVRWAEWSVWEVRPPEYDAQVGDRVTGIDDDVFTYRIGIGRSINDQVAIFGRVTYEEATGGVANRLSPTDGSTSFGFGGSYTMDAYEISGGIEYALLGDGTDSTGTAFEDNTAIGFGVNIGFSF